MRKIVHYRALFILNKKRQNFHYVIEKEVFDSHSEENRFVF